MFSLFKLYKYWVIFLIIIAIAANGLSLIIPKLISNYIDQFQKGTGFSYQHTLFVIGGFSLIIFFLTFSQYLISVYLAEKVAYDLREKLSSKLKDQSFKFVADKTPSTLLTYMTSDVDQIKNLLSQGLVNIFMSLVTLVGVVYLMLKINVHLALITLSVTPFMVLAFYFVFKNLTKLFTASQENVERINKVVNESIIAAALIRVLNSALSEIKKFDFVNNAARDIGLTLNKYFSTLIPILFFLSNIATLFILWFGGRQVISGTLSLGDMNAFFSYSMMFIWPLFFLGFSGSTFSRANVSWKRLSTVFDSEIIKMGGTFSKSLEGKVEFNNVNLTYNERQVLKNITFTIKPKTRTAIIGPTAAGKTRIFYLLSGLVTENNGEISIDDQKIENWEQEAYLSQVGLVFQDSVIFNTTIEENIMFRDVEVRSAEKEALLTKAIETAELGDLIEKLPQGIKTHVSERGVNLSGGQKQRLMLARALSVNPKLLLLDDFTARVDIATEKKIYENIEKNYPELTLISITQKIEPIKEYEKIILLMEGELLAQGTHAELMSNSFEYRQIYESQQRTQE